MDVNLPAQRKTFKAKNKAWRKDCMNSLDTATSLYYNDTTRRRVYHKIINQELFEGKVNMDDMVQLINPYNVAAETIPTNIVHHPIAVPKINLLIGEESKRPFDWSVIVGDYDGISQKQDARKDIINEKIEELISKDASEEEVQAELKRFALYLKFQWKDLREVRATKLLKYYWKDLELKEKFTEGFTDALILGEEIYQCGIQDGEPVFEKLNPIRVHTIRGGKSSRIEDADIIIIEDHWSPSRVLDTYYDKLKTDEIDRISEGYTSKEGAFDDQDYRNSFIVGETGHVTENFLQISHAEGHRYNRNFLDNDGNVRVLRCYWSSLKKAFGVTYIDEDGDQQTRMEAEEYIADASRGETLETLWIREWWHGCKIGADIYPVIEPMPVQYYRLSNPSKAHPGIVGEIYNTNQGIAVSLMDRMKQYQYLHDIAWDRLNKALAKNWGSILEIDMAKIPTGWTVHKWMSFAAKFGIGFVDSFKEGVAGNSQGKLAGNFNTTGKTLTADTGNYIQQHINLMEYIKAEMGEITGITPQRQGAVSTTETVGGVERAVMQSSNTTAWLFEKHKNCKIRALTILLETAKVALKGNKKKLQNILDDFSTELFEIDGDEFSERDYDIFVTSEGDAKEKEQLLNQSAQHAFMQNSGKFSTVMDIMFSNSITEKMRKIELAEQEISEQQQQQQQQVAKIEEQKLQAAAAKDQADRDFEKYKVDEDNSTKLLVEQMKQQGNAQELEAESSKTTQDRLMDIRKLQAEIEMNKERVDAQKMKKNS